MKSKHTKSRMRFNMSPLGTTWLRPRRLIYRNRGSILYVLNVICTINRADNWELLLVQVEEQ